MTRISQGIDKQLIALGKKHMLENGVETLSIRHICTEANINLGLFVYYFKDKKNFIRVIIKDFLSELEQSWLEISKDEHDPLDKLKKSMLFTVRQMKENKRSIEQIMNSIDRTDDFYKEVFHELKEKWMGFFIDLIEGCKAKGYFQANMDNSQILSIFLGSISSYVHILCQDNVPPEDFYVRVHGMLEFLLEKILLKTQKEDIKIPPPPRE
jgi:AcrR family transcriptional regulator